MRLCAILMSLLLAACGSAGNVTNTPTDNSSGQGYGDEHGAKTELGKNDMPGGYNVQLYQVENEAVSEGIFEVYVRKDGQPTKDVSLDVWYGNADGDVLTPIVGGMWMDDLQAFDCHVMTPPDGLPENPYVWVRLRHGDYNENTGFSVNK